MPKNDAKTIPNERFEPDRTLSCLVYDSCEMVRHSVALRTRSLCARSRECNFSSLLELD